MSRRGTLIFYVSPYVSVRLCFRPHASLPVSTLSTVAHRALFHRSLSTYSVLFVLLACPVLSFFPLIFSFLFFLFFSFSSSFSSSLIFYLPILLTLLALPATHHFLSKNLYREHALRNCDVPLAATHPFELKTLYRERGERCCP